MASWLNWLLRLVRLAPTVADVVQEVAPSKTSSKISEYTDTLASATGNLDPQVAENQRNQTIAGAAASHASHIAGPRK